MKILLLSWNFAPVIGGLEDLVTNLFRGLRRAGHAVQIATAHAPGVEPETGVVRASRPGLVAYLIHAFRTGWTLCGCWKPEVIVCGSVVPAPLAWILSIRFRVPFVVIIHGSDVLFEHWIYRRAIRFVLARADRIVANSRQTSRFAEAAGLDPSRMSVVHPGVDVHRFQRESTAGALEFTAGRRVLLSVGRLVRRKGIPEFIEHVMPRLVEADPTLLYVVVGGDATASLAHRERLSDLISAKIDELGFGEHVKLMGELPDADVICLYRRADLFVLPVLETPGDVEGFGIVFLEAALAHTASVSTWVGGIPEAVQDGYSGLLVDPGDHAAMARAILRLLDDCALRERLARQGEARARGEFAWEAITARYERLLGSVVALVGRGDATR